MEITNEQIATDWELWGEFVDPSAVEFSDESEFNAADLAEKVAMIADCFGE